MDYFLELFVSGLTRGSIYALIALGYTMVYGILGLINFAHGEIYMIGAFTGLIAATLLSWTGLPPLAVLLLAAAAAAAWAAAWGLAVERVAYRPLRGAPRLAPLISAIGMSILLQNFVLIAQTSDFVSFPALIPEIPWLAPYAAVIGSAEVVILLVTAAAMLGLTLFVRGTRTGRAMRAVAQDRTMALLCGVDVDRVIGVTFAVGSALAALGGVLIGSHVGQINFAIGFLAGIKAFTAAVLGGIGSIPGAVLGGFILGWTESFAAGYISSAYEDAFAFCLLVAILIVRPSGILGRSDRGAGMSRGPGRLLAEVRTSLLTAAAVRAAALPAGGRPRRRGRADGRLALGEPRVGGGGGLRDLAGLASLAARGRGRIRCRRRRTAVTGIFRRRGGAEGRSPAAERSEPLAVRSVRTPQPARDGSASGAVPRASSSPSRWRCRW